MDFRTFVRIIAFRWKIVVAAILACLFGAAMLTAQQTKTYEASATILMSLSGAATVNEVRDAAEVSQLRLSSYAEIAGGRTVAQRAIDRCRSHDGRPAGRPDQGYLHAGVFGVPDHRHRFRSRSGSPRWPARWPISSPRWLRRWSQGLAATNQHHTPTHRWWSGPLCQPIRSVRCRNETWRWVWWRACCWPWRWH